MRDQVFLVPVIPFSIGPGLNPGAFYFSGSRFGPGKVLVLSPGPANSLFFGPSPGLGGSDWSRTSLAATDQHYLDKISYINTLMIIVGHKRRSNYQLNKIFLFNRNKDS